MLHFRIGVVAVVLCALSGASYAQSDVAPLHAKHKTHIKRAPKADNSSVENWDLAVPGTSSAPSAKADLGGGESEGRKKFFEQSTTMDNSGPGGTTESGKPMTSGFMPSMGMNF